MEFLSADQLDGKIQVTDADESLEFAEKICKLIKRDKRREAGIFLTAGKWYHKTKTLYAVWATPTLGPLNTKSSYKRSGG